jgi:hypothetical protein
MHQAHNKRPLRLLSDVGEVSDVCVDYERTTDKCQDSVG